MPAPSGAGAPLSPELPARLREATHDLHAQAERSALMRELLGGRIGRPRYIALLHNLQALYAALEAALEQVRHDAAIASLDLEALRRSAALTHDLTVLQAGQALYAGCLCPAIQTYVCRLHGLAAKQPRALVAHAYVRYLGDLSGGQALKRLVSKQFGLAGNQGTRFYDFGSPAEVARHRNALRHALAHLPLQPTEADLVVDEACWAFRQHQRFFEELQSA